MWIVHFKPLLKEALTEGFKASTEECEATRVLLWSRCAVAPCFRADPERNGNHRAYRYSRSHSRTLWLPMSLECPGRCQPAGSLFPGRCDDCSAFMAGRYFVQIFDILDALLPLEALSIPQEPSNEGNRLGFRLGVKINLFLGNPTFPCPGEDQSRGPPTLRPDLQRAQLLLGVAVCKSELVSSHEPPSKPTTVQETAEGLDKTLTLVVV